MCGGSKHSRYLILNENIIIYKFNLTLFYNKTLHTFIEFYLYSHRYVFQNNLDSVEVNKRITDTDESVIFS